MWKVDAHFRVRQMLLVYLPKDQLISLVFLVKGSFRIFLVSCDSEVLRENELLSIPQQAVELGYW